MGLETPAPLASHQASEPVTEDSAEETQRLLKTLVEFTEATSEHVPNLGRAEWVRLRGLLAIPALFMLITGLAFTMSTVHYDKQVEIIESGLGVSIPTNDHSPVAPQAYSRDLCDPENSYYGQSDGILAPTPSRTPDGRRGILHRPSGGRISRPHGVMGQTIHFSDHVVRSPIVVQDNEFYEYFVVQPLPVSMLFLQGLVYVLYACIPYVFYRYVRQSNVRGEEAKAVLEAKGIQDLPQGQLGPTDTRSIMGLRSGAKSGGLGPADRSRARGDRIPTAQEDDCGAICVLQGRNPSPAMGPPRRLRGPPSKPTPTLTRRPPQRVAHRMNLHQPPYRSRTSMSEDTYEMIVVDAANIVHTNMEGDEGQTLCLFPERLERLVELCESMGWNVKCFMKHGTYHWASKNTEKPTVGDVRIFDRMIRSGHLTLLKTEHDDIWWIDYAMEQSALILTKDRFKGASGVSRQGLDGDRSRHPPLIRIHGRARTLGARSQGQDQRGTHVLEGPEGTSHLSGGEHGILATGRSSCRYRDR